MSDESSEKIAGAGAPKAGAMKASTIDVAGLDGGLVRLTSKQLDELDSRVEGPVLRAGDSGLGRCCAGLERHGREGSRAGRSADLGRRRRCGGEIRT